MRSAVLRLLIAGVWAGVSAGAWGQGTSVQNAPQVKVVEPPVPLLQDHIGAWALTSSGGGDQQQVTTDKFRKAGCTPIMPTLHSMSSMPPVGSLPASPADVPGDGDRCSAILREDGLTRYAMGHYTQTPGSAEVSAFAEQFGDATGALSAYTFYRSLMKSPRLLAGAAKLGNQAASEGDTTLVLAGTALLEVKGRMGREDLDRMAAGLPKVGGRSGVAPLLPTLLPKEGLDAASERYALGPVAYGVMGGVLPPNMLSWDKDAESITAQYSGRGGSKGTLTLLMYPTPQIAGDRGRAIEKALNDAGGKTTFGTVRLRRVGPLLGLTTGAFSAEQAASLIGGLHLTQDLSYDAKKPLEFHAEVQKTASLLQNIAVLCGVLILAAILLGLFLGGARAGWRVMHGKPAASEPEFLTISLRDKPNHLFVSKDRQDAP